MRDQSADPDAGRHPQVHALKWESRFLVDPGGFEDLARALTVAYTPYHADDALGRLAWLLNVRLTGHSYEAFRGWGLAEELGIERYQAAAGQLWQQLAWYEFDEAVPTLGYRSGLAHAAGAPAGGGPLLSRPGRADRDLARVHRGPVRRRGGGGGQADLV
ncbi:MAG TPA: hypothetical protein VMU94_28200 [Streptosporangiaceae bacterium]|nr:hypothetical protein [Streptosporangiaceae bacterium]